MMFTKLYTRLKQRSSPPQGIVGESSLYLVSGFVLLLALGLLAFALSLLHKQRGLEAALWKAEEKSRPLLKKKQQRDAFLQKYKQSDPDYLVHKVAPLHFLDKNIEVLAKIQAEGSNTSYRPLQERIEFLQSEQNQLLFVKRCETTFPSYRETEWSLAHPIELSSSDLQKILYLIEGEYAHRPQLFFKKLSLAVQERQGEAALFTLDCTITQRDPTCTK